jgi:pyruvate/2-oxoglutarate dehydrogenase complex dihydrolipoamide acyltransferase (E2) component
MAKQKESSSNPRVEAGLVEEDFEYVPREDVPESIDLEMQQAALDEERRTGVGNPTGVVLSAPSATQNPYVSQEEQGMELAAKTFGPPQYGSPDPATASSRLLTLEDGHPLDMVPEDHPAAISGDYAQDVIGRLPSEAASDLQRHAAGDFSVERNDEVDATDAARELANENSVDLSQVEGTGQDGRVTVDDVKAHLDATSDES